MWYCGRYCIRTRISPPCPLPPPISNLCSNYLLSLFARLSPLLLLTVAVAAPFAGGAPAEAQASGTTLWSATLTARALQYIAVVGCINGENPIEECSNDATLTEDEFTYLGKSFSVNSFSWRNSDGRLVLSFREFGSVHESGLQDLTLHVGNTQVQLAGARIVTNSFPITTFQLPTSATSHIPVPSAGDTLDLKLTIDIKPATLDTAFSTDGKATTDFGNNDEANAVAIQSDGKIVTAGFANDGTDDNFAIARYNADGTLDTSFSTDGKVTTDFGGNDDQARAVAIQPDGKIVAAGFANDGSDNNFALARYNTNGSLDTTFSSDGKLTTDFDGKDDEAYAVAIQPDGRIVAAGYATNTNQTTNITTDDHKDFALTRYNSDGSLDESFSNQTKDFGRNDGKVTSLINIYDQEIYAMTIQSDGKIVVVGRSWSGIGNDFAVERYRPNGSRDHTFGFPLQSDVRPGRVTTDFSGTGDYPHAIALQPDGKIVVAGRSWSNGNHNFALVRYTAQGDLDTMFGNGGKVRTDINGDDVVHAVAVLSNGKIIAAGGGGANFGLARYTANGELDTEFDNRETGKAVTDFDGNADEARAIAIQSDGKIVVAGYANNGSDTDFAIARYIGDFDFQGAGQNAPVNRATTVALPIADVDDLPVGESRRISLVGVFSYAGLGALTILVGSSDDDVARVSADLDGSNLTLSGESEGTATIRVIAEDPQGERVFDEFDVAVTAPPNSAPTVSAAIADVTIVNESGAREVSLAGVFSDGDGDDLTVTASSSDEGVATASVDADYSELTVSAKSRGTATMTVTVSDGNGGSVEDAFTVTVKSAPSVASAFDDISGLEAEDRRAVSLSGVFSDADGDTVTVTNAASSDNTKVTIITALDPSTSAITGLTIIAKSEGTATVTVTAQDSDGNTVQDAFDVTVNAAQQQLQKANNAPTVANPIADATITNESGTHEVSLASVFSDDDGDDLTIKATSSAKSVATVAVSNDTLTVTAKSRGTTNITVTADDGEGGTVEDAFTVTVKAAPRVASSIPDATMVEVSSKELDLSTVFSDADGDKLNFSVSSTDLDVVAVFEFLGTMTVLAIKEGTETVTVTAQDTDGNTVTDTFDVTVNAAVQPEPIESEPEQEPQLQQQAAQLPGAVTNLTVLPRNTNITVSWEAPTEGGAPTGYIAHIKPVGGGNGHTMTPSADKTTVKFRRLDRATEYLIWVRAVNEEGKGDRTPIRTATK